MIPSEMVRAAQPDARNERGGPVATQKSGRAVRKVLQQHAEHATRTGTAGGCHRATERVPSHVRHISPFHAWRTAAGGSQPRSWLLRRRHPLPRLPSPRTTRRRKQPRRLVPAPPHPPSKRRRLRPQRPLPVSPTTHHAPPGAVPLSQRGRRRHHRVPLHPGRPHRPVPAGTHLRTPAGLPANGDGVPGPLPPLRPLPHLPGPGDATPPHRRSHGARGHGYLERPPGRHTGHRPERGGHRGHHPHAPRGEQTAEFRGGPGLSPVRAGLLPGSDGAGGEHPRPETDGGGGGKGGQKFGGLHGTVTGGNTSSAEVRTDGGDERAGGGRKAKNERRRHS
mmetsp:Transcript_31498/g.72127  ORF Transcript_31498/g.72127 Transcript_31498/m.72127 type:complete len:336 (+) Transcript_31498:116-1123(+)